MTVSCAVVCLELCFLHWDEDNCGVPLQLLDGRLLLLRGGFLGGCM